MVFLSLTITLLLNKNVKATDEVEYVKITVNDYYGHESDYLKTETKRYVVCGIIDGIYLSYPEQGIHGFRLKSFDPIFYKLRNNLLSS